MRQSLASTYLRWRLAAIATISLFGAIAAGLGTAQTALAAQQVITSAGPLTSIHITDQLNCQVSHSGDSSFEFYPPANQTGDCGTFVVVGGTLYGFAPFSGSAAGNAQPRTAFTAVSQSAVQGSGTTADPFRIVTVVAAGATGIAITETDSYVVGQEVYRTDVQLANTGGSAQSVLLYRAGDCFLQSSDFGFGRLGPDGAVACTVDQTPTSRIEQWVPITGGSHSYETFYNTGWIQIGSQQPFNDTCNPSCSFRQDNWAGLSWAVSIPAASSLTISHLTVFSPLGTTPLTTTKTADSGTAAPAAADGYTITVSNGNSFAVTLNSIFDDLPAGFTYTLGSTTGVTTADPAVAAQHLTWSGPFTIAGSSSVSLHFGVTVSSVPGDYFNNAGGDAGNTAVAPTGPTAKVTVTSPADQTISATGTPISATEGASFSGTVATFTDPDSAATASEYAATITWGDGASSPGTISGSAGSFTVTGSHTYAEEGTYSTMVTISDVDTPSNTATVTSTATVTDAALTASCAITASSSQSFSGATATFTDAASPSGTLTDFSATISWGDGTSSPGTVTGPDGGPYTVSGSHTYAGGGPFTITTTITDIGGSTTTATCSNVLIIDPAISATGITFGATEGASLGGPVATFTDPDISATASEYSATIAWGDGLSSAGTISGAGGSFTVSGSHTYAEEGTYAVTVTITDVDNPSNTATANSTARVADAELTASCATPANSTTSFNGTTATFTDAASPAGTLSDFSATIAWGDGSTSAGTVSGPDGGPYTVSGSHTYTSTGFFTISTTITDVGGSSTTVACSNVLIFAFAPGGGSFAIGNLNSANTTAVTFWGAKWWKLNSLSGGNAPASFKGFAESPATPSCGVGWTADPGNSTPPPAGPLPAFMAVTVTSTVTKSGPAISGDTVHIVVVKTNPGYEANPGHAGTGTVVAQVC